MNVATNVLPTYPFTKQPANSKIKGYALVFAGATLLSPIDFPTDFLYNSPLMQPNQYQEIVSERSSDQVYFENAFDLMKIKNLNTIYSLSLLQEDWNGNGGRPFHASAITHFASIIKSLQKQPDIAPTGRCSLYMQYLLDDKSKLAFEVSETKVDKVFVPQGNFGRAETEIFYDAFSERIEKSVRHFYGQKQD